jgi:hypothetical protein
MKPTTQPQSHLVFANAQPRYVSMCLAPPSGRHLGRTSPRKSVASVTVSPTPSAGAAPQASYRRRPYHLRAIKTHRANFR